MDERSEPWDEHWRGRELFAFIERRDDVVGSDGNRLGTAWILDVVRSGDVAHLLGTGGPGKAEIPFVPTAQVVLQCDGAVPVNLAAVEEGTWHTAKIGDDLDHPVRIFRDLYGDVEFASKASVSQLDSQTAAGLADLVSLDDVPETSPDQFDALPSSFESMAVINVGQGNSNALCGQDGIPFGYFDLGAGCLWNTRTRPPGLRFCYSREPYVVLSHWDFDHWSGAVLPTSPGPVPDGTSGQWVAPSQPIGPRTQKFAARLHAEGRLSIWPSKLARRTQGGLTILKCTGASKNDSGLAVFVQTAGGLVLSTGDAAFNYVPRPRFLSGPLAGLVAPHHGSSASIGRPVPRSTRSAPLAFSFGANNTYGHPGSSRALYRKRGWSRQFDTPNGTVALGSRAQPAACGGRFCSLGSTQP